MIDTQESISMESQHVKRMSDLDNESLLNIFYFLSCIDVLNAECVNKRFQNVAKIYWQQKAHFYSQKDTKSISDKRKRAMATVIICSRIGDRLKSINLELFEIDWKDDEFVSIGLLCPNITSITFYDNRKIDTYFPAGILFHSFHSLKELHFGERGGFRKYLSSFQLNSIPNSIEILIGVRKDDRICEKGDDLFNFFINHSELVEIEATYFQSSDYEIANIFPVIASHCPRLKKLTLDHCSFTFDGIELLEGMKVLKLESIDGAKISDDQMISICNQNSELEEINIYPARLSIRAFESIVELKKLRELHAYDWTVVQLSLDEKQRIMQNLFINSGTSLTHLYLPQWFLTTRTIERMADLCPVLRFIYNLYISSENVSTDVIRYLIDRIVERPEWKNGRDELELYAYVNCNNDDEGDAVFASFEALKSKHSSLPDGVWLDINRDEDE